MNEEPKVGDKATVSDRQRADELGGLDDDIPEYATEDICFCCTYGNHDIRCTCEGTGCCHPEAYKDYNPAWGHGPLAKEDCKPEEK